MALNTASPSCTTMSPVTSRFRSTNTPRGYELSPVVPSLRTPADPLARHTDRELGQRRRPVADHLQERSCACDDLPPPGAVEGDAELEVGRRSPSVTAGRQVSFEHDRTVPHQGVVLRVH